MALAGRSHEVPGIKVRIWSCSFEGCKIELTEERKASWY
jgi:hypothetical protein